MAEERSDAYRTLRVEGLGGDPAGDPTVDLPGDPLDGIVVCTLHRPEVHNALNLEMIGEIRGLLQRLGEEGTVKALIFTGAGERAFLSGADVGELRERGRMEALRRLNAALFREIEEAPFPTIAAIRGFAIGGGNELAMACDLRVCGESSRFGQPEVGVGIVPGAGACYRLPRLVGLGRAKELIYTGRIIDAAEALAIGLVNKVVPDEEVLDAARAMAASITRHSKLAVRLSKMVIDTCAGTSTETGLALESAVQAILFEDDEKKERMTRFLERRKKPK